MNDRSETAFDSLIERYAGLIRSSVRRVTGNHADMLADDAEQEVRLAVWQFLEKGKKVDHPYSFLVKVATRVAVRMVKKVRSAEHISLGEEAALHQGESALTTADHARAVEIRSAVASGLAQLTSRRRAAVRAYLGGMNHEEVARHLGWSPSSARHSIYDGLKSLREHLKEQGVDLAQD